MVVGGLPAEPRDRLMEKLFNLGRIKLLFSKIDSLTERLDRLEKTGKNG
jgi:hypothetical protein